MSVSAQHLESISADGLQVTLVLQFGKGNDEN